MAIGLDVDTPPEPDNPEEYDYEKCPFYGDLPVRGQTLVGTVVSTDMDKTVVVEREYDVTVPKYDRQMKRRSRIPAHVPGVLEGLSVGDTVTIAETRPLSKTKSHVVVERTDEASAEDVAELTRQTEPDQELSASDVTEGAEPEAETEGDA